MPFLPSGRNSYSTSPSTARHICRSALCVYLLQNEGVSGDARSHLAEIVREIVPVDDVEERHRLDALAWIASGVELYRYKKPDLPPKHLVAYIALVDLDASALL